jgi:ferredoxin-type protein NapG
LRPPGALDEKDFLSSCIKCGQCVQVCPVEAIKLADLVDGMGVGTPYIDAREQACDFLLRCGAVHPRLPDRLADLPQAAHSSCAQAPSCQQADSARQGEGCRTDAQPGRTHRRRPPDPAGILPGHARQGFQGARCRFNGKLRYMSVDRWKPIPVADFKYDREVCDLCEQACPIKGAITVEMGLGKDGKMKGIPVVHEACVGCGVCEMICPTEPASIEIIPGEGWRA